MSDFRRVPVGEVTLRVALQGQGPLVVMVHGFPEGKRIPSRVIGRNDVIRGTSRLRIGP